MARSPGANSIEVPKIEVVEASHDHMPQLEPMIEYWMVKGTPFASTPKEVIHVKQAVAESLTGDNPDRYFVAQHEGRVLGMMGVQSPATFLLPFVETKKPTSIITALVDPESRQAGVGKTLVQAIMQRARQSQDTEVLVSSTDKYKKTGWPFWRKQFGEPVGQIPYKPGREMMVWRRDLRSKKEISKDRQIAKKVIK